jgi:hypothetical protein
MSKIKCLTEGIPFSVVWRCQLLCSYIVQFRRAKTESGKLFTFICIYWFNQSNMAILHQKASEGMLFNTLTALLWKANLIFI